MRIYSQEIVSDLIMRIYDAALDPTNWSGFLESFGRAVDGHGLNLSLIDPSNSAVAYGVVHARCDPAFLEKYKSHYSTLDPWVAEGRRRNLLRPGVIALGEPIVPATALKRTEFYNDLGRYYRFCGGLAALFEADQSVMAFSAVQYKFGQFGDAELKLVEALVPHLKRALKIYLRLDGAGLASAPVVFALDRIRCGIFFVSASGRLLFANQTARALLQSGEGVLTVRGELHAASPGQTLKLRQAITTALHLREGGLTDATSTVVIHRPSGRRPFSVLVAPLPRRHVITGLDTAALAIFVTDPESTVLPPVERIRVMFGLTVSEAQLAQRLASGQTLQEAADQLSIRRETARKRLKVIFHKSDTHRQSDLVRLVLLCTVADTVPQ
jgi:DNA-binding CsgD family transcriptional regulator